MNRLIVSDDDIVLQTYLNDISRYKFLTEEETLDLAAKAKKGNISARDRLVQANLRYVVSVALTLQDKGVPLMDLIEEGNIGLLKAIEKFDVKKGISFIGYAKWWIRQAMYQSIYWDGREIRIPITQHKKIIILAKATKEFEQKNERSPNAEELAELTNIPVGDIDHLSLITSHFTSIDDFIGDSEEGLQVCDTIPNDDRTADEEIDIENLSQEIDETLKHLDTREQDIIRMLYGIGIPPIKKQVIADMYGIGLERVRQIRDEGLRKLKTVHRYKFQKFL